MPKLHIRKVRGKLTLSTKPPKPAPKKVKSPKHKPDPAFPNGKFAIITSSVFYASEDAAIRVAEEHLKTGTERVYVAQVIKEGESKRSYQWND